MKLAKVGFLGVASLPDESFDLRRLGEPRDLVVVTGPQGSGKTAFLEAIIIAKEEIAPYGGRPRRRIVRHGRAAAKITMDWVLDDEEIARLGGERLRPSEALFGEGVIGASNLEPDDGLRTALSRWSWTAPKIEYFHADRRIEARPWPRSSRISAADRLATDNAKYDGVNEFIVEAVMGLSDDDVPVTDPKSTASQFRSAFEELCPSKLFRGLSKRPEGTYAGFSSPGAEGPWVTIDELSHAEKQALIFSATFLRCRLSRSVVLIDSPELYLPSDQIEPFLSTLARFGDNQLIVATSSREIVSRVEPSAVIRLPGA